MMAAPLSLPPWAVGPEDVPSLPKSKVLEILDSALTIAALHWPDELSARQTHILHNLDKALQQQQASTIPKKNKKKTVRNPNPPSRNNITITVDLRRSPNTAKEDVVVSKPPPTAAAKDDDDAASTYERKLEMSKRKLEKGYAAHEEARNRKRSKVIDFHLPPGPTTKKTKTSPSLAEEATATATRVVAKTKAKPKPPRWWTRLKNERDDARIRNLVHSEIREQQRRHCGSELEIYS
ncbi:unnamed protein product [Linum trigynum]|uniref:Uncharacterized protein n=1 Tax=Linum trigynum TaxID=586398 RepID=A0AAV2EB47_9ROSI